MSILTASVTDVQIGPFNLQGLMNENGEFGVAMPQMASINLVPRNRSLKQVKALVGEGFSSHEITKWKTPLNSKPVNVIKLDGLQSVIRLLDKQGNPTASAFVDAMFGLSLHQVFADAFGLKFEAEDRQRWLSERLEARHNFRPLTDQLQRHGFTDPCDFRRFIWAMQTKVGMASGERDIVSSATLSRINVVQTRLMTLMECGVTPWEALKRI